MSMVTPPNTSAQSRSVRLLKSSCRAPSLHNSQPWKWIFDSSVLHLFADHARVGHHTDVTGQEVILSCGAVLDHFRVVSAVERLANHHRQISRSARSRPSGVGELSPDSDCG